MKKLILQLGQALAVCVLLVSQSIVAQERESWSAAELDQMLAPVALYPDTVLTHVLIAATYPLEVVQASRWVKDNPGLNTENAVQAVEDKHWDPSVKALVAFPQLLQRLSDDLDWTQQLGEAFLADETAVLASIQQLREKAYRSGNLHDNEQVVVQREREVIVIEPARKEVVYVPVYDTRIVYGDWWWPSHPPVYWHSAGVYYRNSPFHWGVSVNVRPWFYFGIFDWQRRHVVVHHHYYHKPPRYYPKRHKHYSDARRWQHNAEHRRGVHYRHERLNRHYNAGYGYQPFTRELQSEQRRHREQRNSDVVVREHKAQYQRKTAEQVRIRELRQQPDNTLPRQHRPVTTEPRMRTTEQSLQQQQPQQQQARQHRPVATEPRMRTTEQSLQQHQPQQQQARQTDKLPRQDRPVAQRHINTEQLRQRNESAPIPRDTATQVKRPPSEPMRVNPQPRQPAPVREHRAPQRDVTVQRQERAIRQID